MNVPCPCLWHIVSIAHNPCQGHSFYWSFFPRCHLFHVNLHMHSSSIANRGIHPSTAGTLWSVQIPLVHVGLNLPWIQFPLGSVSCMGKDAILFPWHTTPLYPWYPPTLLPTSLLLNVNMTWTSGRGTISKWKVLVNNEHKCSLLMRGVPAHINNVDISEWTNETCRYGRGCFLSTDNGVTT